MRLPAAGPSQQVVSVPLGDLVGGVGKLDPPILAGLLGEPALGLADRLLEGGGLNAGGLLLFQRRVRSGNSRCPWD